MPKSIAMVLAIVSAIVLIGSPWTAHAIDTPGECASIAERDARLDCFDGFFPADEAGSRARTSAVAPLESRIRAESDTLDNWFSITPHRPNYVLPATHNFSPDFSPYGEFGNFFNDTEIKFQLSLKTRIWQDLWRGSSLWVAYTQQSHWQLFADDEASAPFRETNHEPEISWTVPVDFQLFGMHARLASFALNHQSNGRAEPLSRSWNRITGELVLEKGRFVVAAKTWVRVDNPSNDSNPDIEDFMGRIQLGAAYKWDRHTLALGLKNNLSSDNRSGVQADWTFPLTQQLKGYLQLYSGYGESLIDMEDYANRVGIGIALTDWL